MPPVVMVDHILQNGVHNFTGAVKKVTGAFVTFTGTVKITGAVL